MRDGIGKCVIVLDNVW